MSGPIVRRYGFPNFEQIFGKRPLEHGVDEHDAEPGTPGAERADRTDSSPLSASSASGPAAQPAEARPLEEKG